MIPIVYRWDDANAPVARGERRSLCDILYACLVTGYGTKLPAGWTREYVNATFDKAAFRNNPVTGTGFYLRVDGAGATAGNLSNITAFEVMTDVDTGLFPFAATSVQMVSSAIGTTARPWVLVADDKAFWLFIWSSITTIPTTANNYCSDMFFGDGVKWNPDDNYACALVTSSTSYGFNFSLGGPSVTAGVLAMPRKIDGVATPIMAGIIRGGGPGDDTWPGKSGVVYAAGNPILVSRPHLNNAETYTFRGWLPGLYIPCHPLSFGQLTTESVDGVNFLSIRLYGYSSTSYPCNIFISQSDWRV